MIVRKEDLLMQLPGLRQGEKRVFSVSFPLSYDVARELRMRSFGIRIKLDLEQNQVHVEAMRYHTPQVAQTDQS